MVHKVDSIVGGVAADQQSQNNLAQQQLKHGCNATIEVLFQCDNAQIDVEESIEYGGLLDEGVLHIGSLLDDIQHTVSDEHNTSHKGAQELLSNHEGSQQQETEY